MMYNQTKSGCKKINSSEDTVIFLLLSMSWDLDLEDNRPIFFHNTPLMMMHHHTMFGINGSEDTVWTHGHSDCLVAAKSSAKQQ